MFEICFVVFVQTCCLCIVLELGHWEHDVVCLINMLAVGGVNKTLRNDMVATHGWPSYRLLYLNTCMGPLSTNEFGPRFSYRFFSGAAGAT